MFVNRWVDNEVWLELVNVPRGTGAGPRCPNGGCHWESCIPMLVCCWERNLSARIQMTVEHKPKPKPKEAHIKVDYKCTQRVLFVKQGGSWKKQNIYSCLSDFMLTGCSAPPNCSRCSRGVSLIVRPFFAGINRSDPKFYRFFFAFNKLMKISCVVFV